MKMKHELTPAQYHRCLGMLWEALHNPPMNDKSVWERVVERISELEAELEDIKKWKTDLIDNGGLRTRVLGLMAELDKVKQERDALKARLNKLENVTIKPVSVDEYGVPLGEYAED